MLHWIRWYNSFMTKRQKPGMSTLLNTMIEPAKNHYNETTQAAEQQWSLSRYRWRFEPENCQLFLTHQKGVLPKLIAQAQILGSHCHQTQQWQWAWNSTHLPKKSTKSARKLKQFGRQQGHVPLYTAPLLLNNKKNEPLYLAAIGLMHSKADCVYTGQGDQQDVYFLLQNIRTMLEN